MTFLIYSINSRELEIFVPFIRLTHCRIYIIFFFIKEEGGRVSTISCVSVVLHVN